MFFFFVVFGIKLIDFFHLREMSEFLKNYRKYDVKIAQYDDEVYSKNPLLNFRLRKIRKKKKFEMLKHRGELVSTIV